MLTSGAYLPADSSHEVAMADWLVAHGRSLTKPWRYDPCGCSDSASTRVFPDFVLTDTDPATVVEVWVIVGRGGVPAAENRQARALPGHRNADRRLDRHRLPPRCRAIVTAQFLVSRRRMRLQSP